MLVLFCVIVIVSVYWDIVVLIVGFVECLEIIYDFFGFFEEFYVLCYFVIGCCEVVDEVVVVIEVVGLLVIKDVECGFDYGVWVLL